MLVAEIIRAKGDTVYTISPGISLAEACGELQRRRVGALVVCDAEKVVGILSERDVVRAIAETGAGGLAQPVSAHMTAKVVFAEPGETVSVLMERMTDRRIRHLPVMQNERLTGVISIGDVVKCHIDDATREAESLRTYIAG